MIGKTISHYRIIGEIGRGGMGIVYRAEDMKLGRTVALKFLPPEFSSDRIAKERFIREARSASALQHNNVCTIHDIDEAPDGSTFIVMDCYKGETLKEKISRGPLGAREALETAGQIAAGLLKAHEAGIIHRDIKPANIFMTSDCQAKILDFGLAKLRGESKVTREGVAVGTAAYMSPEQAKGGETDHRTDIWSLGALLYEMLAGKQAFEADYDAALIYRIINQDPEPLEKVAPGVPRVVSGIVMKALAKDPDMRYQDASGMKAEIDAALEKIGDSSGGPETLAVRAGRSRSGRGKIVIPLAAAAVVVIAAGYWLASHRGVKPEAGHAGKKIAVLPFENLGKPDEQYFADGITEEITTRLAMLRDLGVVSRTSTRQYAGTDKTLGQIARELGVDYILEGTVRWSKTPDGKDRVRITPQLIRASDDTHLWAEPYDRVIDDIFAIQAEIARGVAQALGITLLGRERGQADNPPTADLEAYQAYLKGRYYSSQPHFVLATWNMAIECYQRAVELDPGFAIAWAELARAHARLHYFQLDLSEERKKLAREAAEKAMDLAPVTPRIHVSLSYYFLWINWDVEKALKELDLAEAMLGQDSDILKARGFIYSTQGKLEESRRAFEMAFKLSPRDADIPTELIFVLWTMRLYKDAVAEADQAIALAPESFWPYVGKAFVYMSWEGHSEKGRESLEAVTRHDPWSVFAWYLQNMFAGDYAAAIEVLGYTPDDWINMKMWARPKSLMKARAFAAEGRDDEARGYCESALAEIESMLVKWPEDPRLHSSLGITLACLGRKQEAISEGRRAVELLPVSKDAFYGLSYEYDLACIYTIAGEKDLAIGQVKRLLTIPSFISREWLRVDPEFRPLSGDARFRDLAGYR